MNNQYETEHIRKQVRSRYGDIARQEGSCCQSSCCGQTAPLSNPNDSMEIGYCAEDLSAVPEGANLGLGCGNPQAIANIKPGEVVLDLGSGAGFDCFLAARQVGENGRVIGVDMTPDMLAKARANALKGDYRNVEFRLGEIEHLPLADSSVDLIISNCVINLSPAKDQVFRDAYRVLRPKGRLAISDVVAVHEIPGEVKENMDAHCGCVAGAASPEAIRSMLRDAGFSDIVIDVREDSDRFIKDWFPGEGLERYVRSASIRAIKVISDE